MDFKRACLHYGMVHVQAYYDPSLSLVITITCTVNMRPMYQQSTRILSIFQPYHIDLSTDITWLDKFNFPLHNCVVDVSNDM